MVTPQGSRGPRNFGTSVVAWMSYAALVSCATASTAHGLEFDKPFFFQHRVTSAGLADTLSRRVSLWPGAAGIVPLYDEKKVFDGKDFSLWGATETPTVAPDSLTGFKKGGLDLFPPMDTPHPHGSAGQSLFGRSSWAILKTDHLKGSGVIYSGKIRYVEAKGSFRPPPRIDPDLFPSYTHGEVRSIIKPEAGLTFSFFPGEKYGRTLLGFVLPVAKARGGFFGEANAEIQDACSRNIGPEGRRLDVSVGAGFRSFTSDTFLFGTNWFVDASRVAGKWHRSEGLGLEFVAVTWPRPLNAIDVSLDWYKGGGFSMETGVTVPVYHDYLEMRAKLAKYTFFDGDFRHGWKAGVELSVPSGIAAVHYELEQDQSHRYGQTVGCSINIPLQFDGLFSRDKARAGVEPAAKEQRLTEDLLTNRVRREWRHPTSVVQARSSEWGRHWSVPYELRWDPGQRYDISEMMYRTAAYNGEKARKAKQQGPFPIGQTPDDFNIFDLSLYDYITWALVLPVEHVYRCAFGPLKKPEPAESKSKSESVSKCPLAELR